MKFMKSRKTLFTTILLALGLLVVCPMVHAVSPPPDGGYPGDNTAEGDGALGQLTSGVWNTAGGFDALFNNNTGVANTATGWLAAIGNTSGGGNTATGVQALAGNQEGINNTATGTYALFGGRYPYSANYNTADGYYSLGFITTGSNNTAVGHGAGSAITTANNVICIGANVAGENVSASCYIGRIFAAPSAGGMPVFVNSNNKLGTLTSSKRFKEDIREMDKASNALLSLKPVIFRYKRNIDPAGTRQFGLVAEEVEKVDPDLVVRDKEGKPYSVRYEQVNAMLLNEFLKEHKRVEGQNRKLEHQESRIQEQEATIAELKCIVAKQAKGIEALAARVREQDSNIQRVSAQIEMSKPTPKVALNKP